jgi:hypothetical protein
MTEKIDEEVSVVMYYSAAKKYACPHIINWRNKQYDVGKIGYYHKIKDGVTIHHIYELVDKSESLWLKLDLNSDNLHWKLEAISDGNAS